MLAGMGLMVGLAPHKLMSDRGGTLVGGKQCRGHTAHLCLKILPPGWSFKGNADSVRGVQRGELGGQFVEPLDRQAILRENGKLGAGLAWVQSLISSRALRKLSLLSSSKWR
jgi:hypothetical protein